MWRERAAAEVEHVELRLQRRRGQRHARDVVRSRVLLLLRAAHDRDVAASAAEVDGEGVAALFAGPVDGAERHHQTAGAAPPRETSPRSGCSLRSVINVSRGVRHVERRQPDLVRGRPLAGHVPHGDVEQGLLVVGRRPEGDGVPLGLGGLGSGSS